MGLWNKLLGRQENLPRNADADEMITVYDEFGRELQIAKGDWLRSVLQPNLEKAWSDAEKLGQLVLGAIQDGFFAEVSDAAAQLLRLQPDEEMPHILRAVSLLKTGKLNEAEQVLQAYISSRGPSSAVLTNLAKVYAARADQSRAMDLLWQALELDPNQDNALLWYQEESRERGGDIAGLEAFRRVATLPGSWRPQLWLARAALKSGDLPEALRLYALGLAVFDSSPIPTDLLFQLSGDLGQSGHLEELAELVAPRFDAKTHGLSVGNNLIKAFLELGRLDNASGILEDLFSLQRPDWRQSLDFWEGELVKAKLNQSKLAPPPKLDVSILTTQAPVWLTADSLAQESFPREGRGIVIFLSGTASLQSPTPGPEIQLGDTVGRLCRGLPLFVAEQVSAHLAVQATCLVPWISGPPAGFVLSGAEWSLDQAVGFASNTPEALYVVTLHLTPTDDPWSVLVRVGRVPGGEPVSECVLPLDSRNPGPAMLELTSRLERVFKDHGVKEQTPWKYYAAPPSELLGHYLLRLEQLLCARIAGMDGVQKGFLHGEREILTGALDLSVSVPNSVSLRILLAEICAKIFKLRPELASEYRNKIERLQERHPLPDAVSAPVRWMFDSAFKMAEQSAL